MTRLPLDRVAVAAVSTVLFLAFSALPGVVDAITVELVDPPPGVSKSTPISASRAETLKYPRLETRLNTVLESDHPFDLALEQGFRVFDDQLQVHILTTEDRFETLKTWLTEHGATEISTAFDLVQANVGLELLRLLAVRDDVEAVFRPTYAPIPEPADPEAVLKAMTTAGQYTTEALGPMNVPAWHTAGKQGQGVKIGVIDSGYGTASGAQYSQLYGTDLPQSSKVVLQSFGSLGSCGPHLCSEHGLGCAEVIYDIAPGVDAMYLASYGGTVVDMANAAAWMKSNGVDIVSVSQGWLSWGPGDGSGQAAQIANDFFNYGGLWVNAAANSRKAHYQSAWNDLDGDGWFDYKDNEQGWENNFFVYQDSGGTWRIFCMGSNWFPNGTEYYPLFGAMIWNQWSGTPATDLRFCIDELDSNMDWVQEIQCWQRQTNTPVVEWYYEIKNPGCYGFSVGNYGGPTSNLQFEYFHRWDGDTMAFSVGDGSVMPPGTAVNSFTAAAIDAVSPHALKDYSSAGPTNGPGGSLTGGRISPDIAGYADVSCNAYGARDLANNKTGFGGTSAACPHTAGAAALVWGANPSYTNTQVRQYLETQAVEMGTAGKDNDYGHGRLRLGTPTGGGGGGGSCTPGPTTLCLNNDRFKVQASYATPQGQSGQGQGVELAADSGYFWFFNSANVEMIVKVLNGCGSNGNYWVFAGGLTNVQVTLTVTDTQTSAVKTYTNPMGTPFQPIQDTRAFSTCP